MCLYWRDTHGFLLHRFIPLIILPNNSLVELVGESMDSLFRDCTN